MRNFNYRNFFSSIALISLLTATTVNAAPVRFEQVIQIINAKPGKAKTGNFSQLRLANDPPSKTGTKNDPPTSSDPVVSPTPPQDDRVIVETSYDVVEEEVCDCEDIVVPKGGFPYYALLPLAAIPLFFIPGDEEPDTPKTPTPTPTTTPTMTPTMTPTPTEPVPEPMTILLFGSGLAGIGMAARRRFGKNVEEEDEG